MKVVDGIEILIKMMKGEAYKLKVWFTNHQRVGGNDRGLNFSAFVFRIEKIQITISGNFAFFPYSNQSWVNWGGRGSHLRS